jgi:lipooligosaccharide transport system permease protein
VKRVEQFDIVMGLVVMPMFLFSGTFFPVSQLPAPIALAVQAVPLYHAVELLRQLTTGAIVGPSLAGHAGYLVLAGTTGLAVAMRRLERTLVK